MVASKASVQGVLDVLAKHIPGPDDRLALLTELVQVPGNQSFTQTIRVLQREQIERIAHERSARLRDQAGVSSRPPAPRRSAR